MTDISTASNLLILQATLLIPCGSVGQESACNAGDTGDASSIPGWERSPGGGNGNLLQCPCLKKLMDRGAW